MTWDELNAEVASYIRRIAVLEDWFNFMLARGYINDLEEREELEKFVETLTARRPGFLLTIREMKLVSKEALVKAAEAYSLYAAHLDKARLDLFRRNRAKPFMRMGIATLLEKVDAGETLNWLTPFTVGLSDIERHFSKDVNPAGTVKSED